MLKDTNCGELRASDEGREIVLAGWVNRRRDHGGPGVIGPRGHPGPGQGGGDWGVVQVVFNPKDSAAATAVAEEARGEYVLRVTGKVTRRRPGTENAELPTGEIEGHASGAEVLNAAKTPPFYITEETDVEELLRLKYRYLDLRRETIHNNIVMRARINKYIRDFMTGRGFIEIETPILTAPTPEGAR